MASPTVGPYGSPILDDFSRTDVSPLPAPYTLGITGTNHNNFQQTSHTMAPLATATSAAQMYRSGTTYGPNKEGWFKLSTLGASGDYFDIFNRLVSPSATSITDSDYIFELLRGATDTFQILKRISGVTQTSPGVFTGVSTATLNNCYACAIWGTGPVRFEFFEWSDSTTGPWVFKSAITDSSGTYTNLTGAGFFGYEMVRTGTLRVNLIGGGTIRQRNFIWSNRNQAALRAGNR